jgi:tetratricopeptide (TPR) repeat protein
MSILDRIMGRSPSPGTPITANANATRTAQPPALRAVPAIAPALTPAKPGEESIRVYDQFGRTVEVGRESWRRDVLLPNLEASRDDPEALSRLVVGALNDGFAADVLEPARHLAATDPQPPRGATLLGAVLLQLKDFAGARDVLERALTRHAGDAYLLANLARAYAALGDEERAQKLIWLALSIDPNEESSLSWLITLANARGGLQAMLDAYLRAAALPGSWRAQLWLARYALERGDLADATRLYEEALGRASPVPADLVPADPVPTDLLMQMSGDLGNRGQARLLVQLTQPKFDALAHGLLVGNNLLRAYIELGMLPEARKLLEQLHARQRPDWREHLRHWEDRLDEAGKRHGEVTAPLEVVVVKLDQPIWARGVLGFESMLPDKNARAPRVHFVCGSGEIADDTGGKVVAQPTNDLGRLTRALPLFLAEELHLTTGANTALLLPWIKQGGFVLWARRWTREFLAPDESPPDLVVFLHVDARATPWTLEIGIEGMRGESQVFDRAFRFPGAAADVLALRDEVRERVSNALALTPTSVPALACPPPEHLPDYLVALEQALAIGLAARQSEANFLYQERAIFDHLFDVALRSPELLRPRMLLVSAREQQSRRRKDMVAEYLGKLALLQEKHPLRRGPGFDLIAAAVDTVRDQAR